ncbi:MAG: amino acid ABC transporter permease [Anaerolineae bacterium]|nr:amino acid ABC transporter permease [Anaerolineae bacterium]
MASITQSKEPTALSSPRLQLDISTWLKNNIFSSFWNSVFFIFLIIATILIIRTGYSLEPVGLSYNLAPNGQPTALGNVVLIITNGALITSAVILLWLIGAILVTYSVATHRWVGPSQWLKDSLYTGPFGALTTLALVLLIIFAIRGVLSWAVFGAEFRTDAESVAILRPITPGAIWGIIGANTKLFAVGRYPSEFVWRVWLSLGLVLALGAASVMAWNFGSPLKRFRQILVWSWLASIPIILFILRGMGAGGPLTLVPTNLWGGLLLTIVISVIGIVVSFPIGVLMALGRRSQTRGVPFTWAWGAGLLLIYWGLFGFPAEPVTLNIPLIFRDPPVWTVTLAPLTYAALIAIIVIGIFWAIGYYLQGNMIKTFSIVYIEVIRGVPLITVLFMAQIMLPIFLPKEVEIDNLLRVVVGVILFSAAYLAENIRGGLQAIPKGQYEAAVAIGLSGAQSMRLIILPQALRLVIPALVGQCISLFKDTSLVAIVGLFDLLKIAQTVVAQQEWLGLQRETYAFVALVYWVFAFSMSRASQRIEKNLGVGKY